MSQLRNDSTLLGSALFQLPAANEKLVKSFYPGRSGRVSALPSSKDLWLMAYASDCEKSPRPEVERQMMRTSVREIGTSEIVSTFQLVVVAGLRAKQLQRGSKPRIEADPKRRRHTSIAVEEVRRGFVNLAQNFGVKGDGQQKDKFAKTMPD